MKSNLAKGRILLNKIILRLHHVIVTNVHIIAIIRWCTDTDTRYRYQQYQNCKGVLWSVDEGQHCYQQYWCWYRWEKVPTIHNFQNIQPSKLQNIASVHIGLALCIINFLILIFFLIQSFLVQLISLFWCDFF